MNRHSRIIWNSKCGPAGACVAKSSRRLAPTGRAGFTLVEMLVAVGLVVLMMSLFATIFQLATSGMGTQRGLAENDQRVRLVATLLRDDIRNRTMLEVAPFRYGESPLEANSRFPDRKGYFYIREGDPDNDTDDILQLTIYVSATDDLLYGRARLLQGNFATDPNQPEFDDGNYNVNNVGSSSRAEVSYFLRSSVLYRRVVLIREPAVPNGSGDGTPKTGTDGLGAPIPTPGYEAGGTLNFYGDFDYSAFYDTTTIPFGPRFHGVDDLDNSAGGNFKLAKPNYRYGHNHATGLPREFDSSIPARFIGRFVHAETSYNDSSTGKSFGYPGRIVAGTSPNPMNPATTLTLNTITGLITEYSTGTRISEDMLMTNVHRFDIKVWDPAASTGPDGQPGRAGIDDDGDGTTDNNSELGWPGSDDGDFRDVGHGGTGPNGAQYGYYRANANNSGQSPSYSYGPDNYRFDTWHPNVDLNGDGIAPGDPPPFRPVDVGPDGKPGVAGVDDDGVNGIDDPGELGWPGSDDRVPLKAIQIRITFFDPASQQLRDITMVHSLYVP